MSSQTSMNVSLPAPMKGWVEEQTRSGRYSNASDYVRDLIRRDQERVAKIAAMQELVTEAESGGLSPLTAEGVRADVRKSIRCAD